MTTKHVTINIGPQDSESWLFFAIAVAAVAVAFGMYHMEESREQTKRVEIQAHQHP